MWLVRMKKSARSRHGSFLGPALFKEWMTTRLHKNLLCFKQKPWCAGEHLGVPDVFITAVDAARHCCFAMDNNPLHTTASGGNLGPIFLGVDWAIFSLSTIIVALRLYTRLCITRNFGLDDAAIALTQVRHLSVQ